MVAKQFRFGAFTLDVERLCLEGPAGRLDLRPKSFDVLSHLVQHAGRIVTKNELLQSVWPSVTVTDESLSQCIHDVRRVLGDGGMKIIKTIPRRGYVLDEAVTVFDRGEQTRTLAASVPVAYPSLPDRPSIAVLPFANFSDDEGHEFFAEGIAEDILTELSKQRWLFVMARNSSFTYRGQAVDIKQAGRELGVRYVLEGSVRRAGNRVRVTGQLIDAPTGGHVWAEKYDRNIEDIFAVQDDITNAVAAAIAPAIVSAEQQRSIRKPPDSLDAWEAYQRGLWHMSKHDAEELDVGRSFLLKAIDCDPSLASAYSWLAQNYCMAGSVFGSMPIDEALLCAEPNARRAIALDSDSADARARLAVVLYLKGDAIGALSEAEQALLIDRYCAEAHALRGVGLLGLGRPAEGRDSLNRCIELSPRSPTIAVRLSQIAEAYYFERDYVNAILTAQHIIRRFPKNPQAYRWLAASLAQAGRLIESRAAFETLIATSPAAVDILVRNPHRGRRIEDHEHLLEGLRKSGWME